MLRITGGEMRSRKLKTLEGLDTRPTADRVKEAVFSILYDRVYGARVLDLYAGSGALALEALSRGAKTAALADASPRACQVIRENIRALACENRAVLLPMKDTAALETLHRQGERFDLVFLDPPYRMDTAIICGKIAELGLITPDGMIVVEHSRETPPQVRPPLQLTDRRVYGITGVSFYQPIGEEKGG